LIQRKAGGAEGRDHGGHLDARRLIMTTFLTRLESHSHYLGQMMERCGVNLVELAQDRLGLTLASVARTCMHCGRTESCRKWLETAERRRVNAPPPFCPNAERLRQARTH
jgi:hypothetical protein